MNGSSLTPPAGAPPSSALPCPADAAPPERAAPTARPGGPWLDLLLALGLFLAALSVFGRATRGDLWFDEADYALAATRGFERNRWDLSDDPSRPDWLIRLRHHHPPWTAQAIGVALAFGREDAILRAPFVLAGALTVAFVYGCGLLLFRRRDPDLGEDRPLRAPALACALLLLVTPPVVRAASHALPWAWITLWLVALLWSLLQFARSRQGAWLAASGVFLGGMFVTSEYFFPTLAAVAASLPFLVAALRRESEADRRLEWLLGFGIGASFFLLVAAVFWPAGVRGHALEMLRYYAAMADDPSFPVTIRGITYPRAPKWAYLHWYGTDYPGLAVLYGAGALAWMGLALRRRLPPELGIAGVFAAVVLAVAHCSHIIGPEYLAHALPLLTLLAGVPFAALARVGLHGVPPLLAAGIALWTVPPAPPLAGMEPAATHPRWPEAARFLAGRWRPGDRMLASQFGVAARWYLVHAARLPAREFDIQALPPEKARPSLLRELRAGAYRFVAVGTPFMEWTPVAPEVRRILRRWRVVWRSAEPAGGRSRLTIYERPARPVRPAAPSVASRGGAPSGARVRPARTPPGRPARGAASPAGGALRPASARSRNRVAAPTSVRGRRPPRR